MTDDPSRPRRIGSYRVVGELGRGGMGVVLRAFDERLQREVALKALPEGATTTPEDVARLEREARSLASVNDPNVATIYGLEEWERCRYLVLELVEGETLRKRLERGPLSIVEAISTCAQVAAGLAAVHRRGLVHRDLKPGNVMVTPAGVAKLLDFGLARRVDVASDVTGTGVHLGTVPYMSPEQLQGGELDSRSDAWAWGCLLFECLTGRGPFDQATQPQTIAAILSTDPDWTRLPAGVPPRVVDLAKSCLSRDRSLRPASLEDVGRALAGAAPAHGAAGRRRRAALLGAGLAGLFGIAALATLAIRGGRAEHVRSVAVVPLAIGTHDGTEEPMASGLAEAIRRDLAGIRSLRVVSAANAAAESGSVSDLGQRLGVDAIVEGSIAQDGSRIRVTLALVDVATSRTLWSQVDAREPSDIATLSSDAARAIARRIGLELTTDEGARLAAPRPVVQAAYEAYLKGRLPLQGQSDEGYRSAIVHFEEAIAADPLYAPAWSGLADAYYMMSNVYLNPEEAMPKARAAASRALELDPGLAEAHVSLASVLSQHDWKWDEALAELDRAIELEPSLASAHLSRAIVLSQEGRLAEAAESYRRARGLDPLSVYMATVVFQPDYLLGRYDEILSRADPKNLGTPLPGLCQLQLGHYEEAERLLRATVDANGSPFDESMLGMALARSGRVDEARAILLSLRSGANANHVLPYGQAVILTALGERDEAFEWLERGWRGHDETIGFLKVDPHLRPLADDPRRADLLRRMHLEP